MKLAFSEATVRKKCQSVSQNSWTLAKAATRVPAIRLVLPWCVCRRNRSPWPQLWNWGTC